MTIQTQVTIGEQMITRRHPGPLVATVLCTLLTLAGCDGLLKNDELPPNVTDPAITKTPEGALAAYQGVIVSFRSAINSYIPFAGMLADELRSGQADAVQSASGSLTGDPSDRRDFSRENTADKTYSLLQKVRGQGNQAIGLLRDYRPADSVLAAQVYAVEGYAEVMLAELFCSGIPLSTLDYNGDYTLRPGSTTTQVLTHAITLFDSALALAGDSVRVVNLARIGRARALLGLSADSARAAAADINEIDDAYQYAMYYGTQTGNPSDINPKNFVFLPSNQTVWDYSIADREGLRGLDYISSGDPRTAIQRINSRNMPAKYAPFDGSSPVVVASGLEARLIEAEAALRQGDPTWLDKLNGLRTDGTNSGAEPADTLADTLGVSGCDANNVCGATAGSDGNTPEYGQPTGGFPVPAGYYLADSVPIDPVTPEIQQYCQSYSRYRPCKVEGKTTVYLFIKPAHVLWNPGTGGVARLGPLSDPGTPEARVDLLFRERAFWLFLTGHREGDLRRLIRQYGRQSEQLYPTGPYPLGGYYGSDVTAPIPVTEQATNPLFTGCASRGA